MLLSSRLFKHDDPIDIPDDDIYGVDNDDCWVKLLDEWLEAIMCHMTRSLTETSVTYWTDKNKLHFEHV